MVYGIELEVMYSIFLLAVQQSENYLTLIMLSIFQERLHVTYYQDQEIIDH